VFALGPRKFRRGTLGLLPSSNITSKHWTNTSNMPSKAVVRSSHLKILSVVHSGRCRQWRCGIRIGIRPGPYGRSTTDAISFAAEKTLNFLKTDLESTFNHHILKFLLPPIRVLSGDIYHAAKSPYWRYSSDEELTTARRLSYAILSEYSKRPIPVTDIWEGA
jgi:hypothetical protein